MISAALAFTITPSASAKPQSGSASKISVETSPQLFAVMCALDAAGFDADVSTLAELPERAALRQRLLQLHGPATEALRQFYRDHALADPAEMLSRYISFALVIGPPPTFSYVIERDFLPPDVNTLEGFDQILAAFYKEARLDREWSRVEPEYNREVARYERPVRQTLLATSSYMRELMSATEGRTFTILVEPLAGNRTNFRNYAEHYVIAVGAGTQLHLDEIRHAYLHFMIDPLVQRNRAEVEKKHDLLDVAAKAPNFPVAYQDDFAGLVDECMVKAIELRLNKTSKADLEAELSADDRQGLILVRPLVEQLKLFEKAEPAMRYYFPDIIGGVDVEAEKARVGEINFAVAEPAKDAPAAEGVSTNNTPADASSVRDSSPGGDAQLQKDLAEGDHQIALQNADAAEAIFSAILAGHPDLPRAEYGMAIASVLGGKADRAKELFERLVTSPLGGAFSDPSILAWSHLYLGRIHDLEGERDLAVSEYDAALGVEGAPEAARVAAERGKSQPYSSGGRRSSSSEKP